MEMKILIIETIVLVAIFTFAILHNKQIIQFAGPYFHPGDTTLLTEPVIVRGFNQQTQEPKGQIYPRGSENGTP